MSLSASLSTANTSLGVTSERSSVISRNIANKDQAFYSRKSVEVITIPGSGVRTSAVTRAEDPILFRKVLTSASTASTQGAVLETLDLLNGTINDVSLDASPAAMIVKFGDAMQTFSAQPHSELAAKATVRSARDLANSLNTAATTVQTARSEADNGIQASVNRVVSLLDQFKVVNDKIVIGTVRGEDVTDFMDQRDEILANMSNELGIRTVLRGDNDMVVYTDSGVTMFDKSPRKVEFDRSLSLTPGQPGNAVIIDGVPVTGANATMPLQSGRIVGLVQARDDISLTYQAHLDEMARVLVTTFAETDSAGLEPDMPGLFTYAGATGVPPDGTLIPGLASMLRVNQAVDPDAGGSAWLLRDGGIAGADYVKNTEGTASYTDHIDSLIERMGQSYAYDSGTDIATSGTLKDFSAISVGWLQEQRKVADDSYQYQNTLYQRSYESFNRVTGVNLDEEVSTMLELERSFSTSSKLISVIDQMYNSLLAAIG